MAGLIGQEKNNNNIKCADVVDIGERISGEGQNIPNASTQRVVCARREVRKLRFVVRMLRDRPSRVHGSEPLTKTVAAAGLHQVAAELTRKLLWMKDEKSISS